MVGDECYAYAETIYDPKTNIVKFMYPVKLRKTIDNLPGILGIRPSKFVTFATIILLTMTIGWIYLFFKSKKDKKKNKWKN